MKAARIRVTVEPGSRTDERHVSFMQARRVMLTVTERDLDGDLLRVVVVGEEDGERVAVRLPAPTLTGAMTATLRRADVLPVGGAS
jgi:hypothetical protein